MIPKIIHYCWFGNNSKPKLMKQCIKSWKKCCPDYEIIEWNESNFDIGCNTYVKEAYEEKKWAFVTDYVRLWIIYHYGGIYLDTDVELIKNLDDLLVNESFFGYEDESHIATGLGFGAKKGNVIVECMLNDYKDIHFIKEDGSLDLTPCPKRNTDAILHLLFDVTNTGKVNVINGATLFPKEYFCPMDYQTRSMNKTKNTYSIHWFNASWYDEKQKEDQEKRLKEIRRDKLIHSPNKILRNILGIQKYEKLKKIIKK
ncbi:glycosyltransferase family 32 protein [Thomasclavelia cocleata]|uniref:glycosyltransferase family 32 protein n=2 Tax=Thomasclavelia cocleata TaxID=69824 RepID=UPI00242D6E06|nr:glycosyltransferase [Thomasclavelia cocleata]